MSTAGIVLLRGGPADGARAGLLAENIRYVEVPVMEGGRFAKARYLVERVNGKPVYAQYVPRCATGGGLRMNRKPEVGELIRWAKPGPVILTIERVGAWSLMHGAWQVRAGGLSMLARLEPEDGIEWVRCAIGEPEP